MPGAHAAVGAIRKVNKYGPAFRLSHKVFPAGTRLPVHRHATNTLSLVLAGEYEEVFDEARQICPRWSLQFKPIGIPHTTSTREGGGRLFILAFRGELSEGQPLARNGEPLQWEQGAVTALALRIFAATFGDDDSSAKDVEGLVRSLLPRLHAPACTAPERLRAAERLIRARPAKATLGRIARELEIHPVYLARAFRRHFGASLGTYARRARIDLAVRRLATGTEPLSALALSLGYCDQSHFSNDFRRETGWTPFRFRRAAAELDRFGSSKN